MLQIYFSFFVTPFFYYAQQVCPAERLGMRGWEKLATALETIKKMTFRRPAQKRKSRPLFPVPFNAFVRSSYPALR